MKKSLSRLFSIVAVGLMGAPAFAAPTTAPAAAVTPDGAAAKPDMKALQDFVKQVRPLVMKVAPIMQDHAAWSDASKRADLGKDASGPLKEIVTLIDGMAQDGHSNEVELSGADSFVTMAAVFGDADVQKQLTDMAAKPDAEGRWATVSQATAKFYFANGDVTAQGKALDGLESLVTADPANKKSVGRAEMDIYEGEPSKEIADRIDTYLTKTIKYKQFAQIKAQKEADAKREAMVGKPMELTGLLKDGTQFTTADLKGKVILVDFWASWCGPCKAELPRVKKEYAEMHDKGLEVIGVSFDQTSDALQKFLDANPDMPWPQMYDPAHPFWQNELGKKYGIQGIPTMFLIDKNGICRSVKAREDFEKMIPQLLAEKPAV